MTIRPVKAEDLPFLAEFWYDQMALLSQKNPAIRLAPDALRLWTAYANQALETSVVLVAEGNGEILGGIIGDERENAVGLLPVRYGQILYLLLDMHSPQRQQNTAGQLVSALQAVFRERGLNQCRIAVTSHAPVEQGFWRGMGAKLLEEGFWVEL